MSDSVLEEIIDLLTLINPASQNQMQHDISKVLSGHLLELQTSHNTRSVIFIFSTPQDEYLLKAEYGRSNATLKEIQWYRAVQAASPALSLVFSFSRDDYAFLVLPYARDAKTLDVLIGTRSTDSREVERLIDRALAKNRKLFLGSKQISVHLNQADRFYLEKYEIRAKESKGFPYLDSLLETQSHRLNGTILHSPKYYLSRIINDAKLHEYLTPRVWGLIHGDLHCGNILVNDDDVYFIDPNGILYMPIEYDYGKVFHSIHGGYNEIMKGRYELEITEENCYFSLKLPKIYTTVFTRIQKQ
jgi:hypothetical protein